MTPAPSASFVRRLPQVVLFGLPRAGKTALLEALGRTPGVELQRLPPDAFAEPADVTRADHRATGSPSVGKSVPAGPTPGGRTADSEITSWLVTLPTEDDPASRLTAVVHDCSGAAAELLLENPQVLESGEATAPVARAIVRADAIALLVDASSDEEQLLRAFDEFDTFLTTVHRAKCTAREVGGFPVILTLTHADKLARPGDSLTSWQQRIEERAALAADQFHDFLLDAADEDEPPSPFLPFGRIILGVETVAIRHPRLTDVASGANAPYRVREFFQECLGSARAHRERVTTSEHRLRWTVRIALGVVLLLLTFTVTLVLNPPSQTGPGLAERIREYQMNEPEAAVRLAYPYLLRNKQTLVGFQSDPSFASIPEELRTFVLARLKEIADYEVYRAKLATALAPGDSRSLDELDRLEASLLGELALPEEYAWGQTQAAILRRKWLADIAAIRAAESRFTEHYRELVRRAVVLTLQPTLAGKWRAEVETLLAEGSRPPDDLTAPLPGSPAIDQPRGQALTYRVPFEYERVYTARQEWDAARDRLVHLRDLGDALGLTEGSDRPEPVLMLPEPAAEIDSTRLAAARWTALLRHYPRESEDYREWNIEQFPDPIRTVLAERLEASTRAGNRHVQGLIRAHMGADPAQKDTAEWWRAFAPRLTDPTTPFPDWGKLLHLLARLRDPSAPNPVLELSTFLTRDRFTLDPVGFDLYLPPDLSLDRVVLGGPLRLSLTRPDGVTLTRTFSAQGPGLRDGGGVYYSLGTANGRPLTYKPGDELRAEVTLRAGNRELRLVWESGLSRVYQFDRLMREPRMYRPDGATEPAKGVRLTPTPATGWPLTPALLPDVRE